VIAHCIRAFCKWWFSELHALVPMRLCRALLRRRELVGVLQHAEFALLETTGNRERQLLRISSDACELDADFSGALSEMKRGRLPLTLRLSSELGLRKLLKLPVAARNDLDQLLRFEIDRLSPFAAEKVHFAHRILQIIEKERCILVEVQIVPRMIVERALATCECLGLQPKRLELGGAAADAALNLLPRHAMRSPRISRLDWALAVLALVLAGLVLVAPLQKQHAKLADLQRQVIVERSEAEKSLELRRQLEALTSTVRFIIDRKKSTLTITGLLAELTRRIPDDAYVAHLHINNKEVRMRGYAQSVSDMIGALEGSPLFWKAEFLSPITRDSHNGREQFQISLGLRPKDG
jgi:general secretion pathway protein L